LAHADPHPGNYRFNSDGTVGFLDFGCATTFPEKQRWPWTASQRAAVEGRADDYYNLMTQLGFITADSPLSPDDLQRWVLDANPETHMPQPVTYTPDAIARTIHGFFNVRDADHALSQVTVPPEFVFSSRILLAINSVLAGLQACLPIRAIFDDLDGLAEPTTELGKQHHAWVRERGLPGALDHHDHP
jgi:predicted unusual protein kinase regulating ubiquinone biosynthesis (AarF/ABC1/UbiB family)